MTLLIYINCFMALSGIAILNGFVMAIIGEVISYTVLTLLALLTLSRLLHNHKEKISITIHFKETVNV